MIKINDKTWIKESELSFAFARSSGPGGQNVNKVESRVTLRFDVLGSASLSEEQRVRIMAALPTRINKQGVLLVWIRDNSIFLVRQMRALGA